MKNIILATSLSLATSFSGIALASVGALCMPYGSPQYICCASSTNGDAWLYGNSCPHQEGATPSDCGANTPVADKRAKSSNIDTDCKTQGGSSVFYTPFK